MDISASQEGGKDHQSSTTEIGFSRNNPRRCGEVIDSTRGNQTGSNGNDRGHHRIPFSSENERFRGSRLRSLTWLEALALRLTVLAERYKCPIDAHSRRTISAIVRKSFL
jgi:hypothetical protein